jgi:hypothetical protein
MIKNFDPHYDFNYKGFSIRIFEIVKKFEGRTPKIVTLKLYINGNFRKEETFFNTDTEYRRHYIKLMRCVHGLSLSGRRKK